MPPNHHHHHNRFTALLPGPPGWAGARRKFWTLWCKERLTKADTPTIRLDATPSGLTSAHLHHPPIFLQAGCPSCRPTNSVKALPQKTNEILGKPLHPICIYGAAEQTVKRIVDYCPVVRFPGDLRALRLANDEAVAWFDTQGMKKKVVNYAEGHKFTQTVRGSLAAKRFWCIIKLKLLFMCILVVHLAAWLGSNGVGRINEVTLHRARLILRRVTVSLVYRLGM